MVRLGRLDSAPNWWRKLVLELIVGEQWVPAAAATIHKMVLRWGWTMSTGPLVFWPDSRSWRLKFAWAWCLGLVWVSTSQQGQYTRWCTTGGVGGGRTSRHHLSSALDAARRTKPNQDQVSNPESNKENSALEICYLCSICATLG